MVKYAANKQAILSTVEAEQSVSYRPTALMVTAADEGRQGAHEQDTQTSGRSHTTGIKTKTSLTNYTVNNSPRLKKREFKGLGSNTI